MGMVDSPGVHLGRGGGGGGGRGALAPNPPWSNLAQSKTFNMQNKPDWLATEAKKHYSTTHYSHYAT